MLFDAVRGIKAMRLNTKPGCALVGMVLLFAACGTAVAGDGVGDSRAFSVWKMSKRTQQQIQMDYAERLKSQLASNPNDEATETELGRTYFWMALAQDSLAMAQAQKCFEDVLARDPNNPVALAFHGSLLGVEIGDRLIPDADVVRVGTQAHEEMDRAVSLAPDSVDVRFIRAYADMYTPSAVGRNNQAIEDFKFIISRLEATGSTDGLTEACVALGDLYNKVGLRQDATAAWEQALRIDPTAEFSAVAATRLGATPQGWGVGSPSDARQLAAFFGFLIGLAIFAILGGRLVSELFRTRRDRIHIAASLLVSLIALMWNCANLLYITLTSLHARVPTVLTYVIGGSQGYLYLSLALLPIPLGLLMAYRFHKATFMDVILKKGAGLLILLVLAVVNAYVWADLVTLTSFEVLSASIRPAIFVGLWLSLFAIYLPLRGRVDALVDKYLLRRRDYSHLIESLSDRARGVTDEEALKLVACDEFKNAFTSEFVHFLAPEDELAQRITSEISVRQGQVILTRDVIGDDLYNELTAQRVELVLTIGPANDPKGVFVFGPRAYGQGYLSEELKLLRAIGGHIAPLLENMQLQVARRQQAVAEQELRKLATQAELKALRAQIDPHFFFNALNSVAALISEDPVAAEDLVADIGELFRHAFKPNRDFITLDQEIELIDTYLKVEKARLGPRLSFERDIDPRAVSVKIPALSIQPLIENAVKHGVSKISSPGTVSLSVRMDDGKLLISIRDTGPGIPPSEITSLSSGVGLSNVSGRLIAIYGEQARLKIDCSAQGTTLSFVIPAGLAATGPLPALVH